MHRSAEALARFGLRSGEPVRFRRDDRGRTVIGQVEGLEIDGNVNVSDPDGSARSLRADRVEIRRPGSSGRLRWQFVADVAITWEQLELFETPPPTDERPGRRIVIRRDHPTLFDE